jgi:hypothetical protein
MEQRVVAVLNSALGESDDERAAGIWMATDRPATNAETGAVKHIATRAKDAKNILVDPRVMFAALDVDSEGG